MASARTSHRKANAGKTRAGDKAAGGEAHVEPSYRSASAWAIFLITAAVGAAVDIVTKHVAFDRLMDRWGEAVSVIPHVLAFRLSTNPGIVGGLELPPWLILLANLAAVAAVAALFALSSRQFRALQLALGMILGGAVGNVYDRLLVRIDIPGSPEPRTGVVRDFIDLHVGDYHWPTFNVADVLLVVGVGLFILHAFRQRSRRSP